jgi:hypothetical protein
MENPIVQAQERFNNRSIPYRIPLYDPCECGKDEAVILLDGKQRLCVKCSKGILGVELL